MIKSIVTYFRESQAELKRVNWPTKDQVKNYTILVVFLSVLTAIFLGGLDYLFSWGLRTFFLG